MTFRLAKYGDEMKRTIIFVYGIFSYLLFLTAVLYAMGFLNNIVVPLSIDNGRSSSAGEALVINVSLIALFGFVHSLMARKRFKAWWTRIIPKAAERSTFVLQASLLLLLIFWQWRPLPDIVWSVDNEIGRTSLQVIHWAGWIIAVLSTFPINHFHFSGLQQVFANLRRKQASEPKFITPFLYNVVRHPMQLGLIIAFWVTPEMTLGRLLFSTAMSIYIFIGLYFEERDLVRRFGGTYATYRKTTPKLIPRIKAF